VFCKIQFLFRQSLSLT